MQSASDIIDLWPDVASFASDIMRSAGHVRTMRDRQSIPRWYWPQVVAGARARGLKVDEAGLEAAHATKRQFGAPALGAGAAA